LVRLTGLTGLRRQADDRAVVAVLAARFFDEVLAGAFTVLAPTFRRQFRLSLVQVSLLDQVLSWVALIIEPPAAALIDLRSRRVLMTFGATVIGLSALGMGLAPSYAVLLAAFGLYGVGSGPLAHTADVVLVEAFPDDSERAFARGTVIDTIGGLLAPALVAAVAGANLSWRWSMIGAGAAGLGYAAFLRGTNLPPPSPHPDAPEDGSLLTHVRTNVVAVLRSPQARRWMLCLLWFDVVEATNVLVYVWLHDHVGMTQSLVALYAVGEHVVGVVALLWMDRWLQAHSWRTILYGGGTALLVIYPAWLFAPGIAGRVVLGIPLAFITALFWPVVKAQSLVSVPGRAGAVQAVANLLQIAPFALLFGALASVIGLTYAMLGATVTGIVLLLVTVP
jgi:predicted MFS family arabinose efflux permease